MALTPRSLASQVASWLVALSLLTCATFASDLKFDGSTSLAKPVGTNLSVDLTGNPGLPAFVLVDVSPGPVVLFGESIDLGFSSLFWIAAAGVTDAAGVFHTDMPIANMPAWAGAVFYAVGVTLDPVNPNGFDVSPGVDLTLIPNQSFFIQSCSLGCSSSGSMAPLTCGLSTIAQNQSIELEFSLPVDLASVSSFSFQIVSLTTGASVPGTFALDPVDSKRLRFDPQLSFDSGGHPVFGFQANGTYQLLVRGANQDGSFGLVQSTTGEGNANRLQCTLFATGVLDYVPGPPTVTMTVEVVTAKDPVTGAVLSTQPMVANGGTALQGVWLESDITLTFDDLMDLSTLFSPTTGLSSTIEVLIDPDGDLATTADQLAVASQLSAQLDLVARTTEVVFDPTLAFPPSGGGASPLLILTRLGAGITDIVGNGITNPATVVFTPDN